MLDYVSQADQDPSTRSSDDAWTFKELADAWISRESYNWTARHKQIIRSSFARDLFPDLAGRPINEITTVELFSVLRTVEARGARNVVKRLSQRCRQVFHYGMLSGACYADPTHGLVKAFKAPQATHRPALSARELPELWHKLKKYSGSPVVRLAFQLLITTFVRPGELRHARWSEIDFDRALWVIPAARMKMRREHIVPLSPLAISILEELVPLTAHSDLLFPGARARNKPISDVTLLVAIRILGFEGRCVPHGFRATAASTLSENGFSVDVIERQLAHIEHNKIKAAYHRSEFLPHRAEMMTWWGNYLEML